MPINKPMHLTLALSAATIASALSIHSLPRSPLANYTVQLDKPSLGASSVELVATTAPFDGPKVTPVNSSTFDWWYFDVVSEDASQSLTVAFYSAPFSGLGFGPHLDTINWVHVSGVFPNGTMFNSAVEASTRAVWTVGDGSSGSWQDSGLGWRGTKDLREYTVTANDLGSGFSGTLKLRSVAPAHYPCGPATAGQSEEVAPEVGWANAIPDAQGEVEFQVGDHLMSFSGYGYHDKNWGSRPFNESVGTWYWGHGRLGDYSLVWFDTLDRNENEYLSAYVTKNGEVITSSCSGVKVRPFGDNATYPPVLSTGIPTGYTLEIDLGDEGTLVANLTNLAIATTIGTEYERLIGQITGSLNGVTLTPGSGLWEQFKTMEKWN